MELTDKQIERFASIFNQCEADEQNQKQCRLASGGNLYDITVETTDDNLEIISFEINGEPASAEQTETLLLRLNTALCGVRQAISESTPVEDNHPEPPPLPEEESENIPL